MVNPMLPCPEPVIADDAADAEEFIDKVDEVNRLIEGLKAGTISPEYVDTKLSIKQQKEAEKLDAAKKCPAGRGPATPQPNEAPDASATKDADQDADAEVERRDRAMAKVKELMANRDRKLRARARYEEYVQSQDKSKFGTDYTKWDIWCPEDEEDELINSIGPSTPQFRAMEKDIDERHRQMVERRQLAERCRVRGNEAYGARQYSEALRFYQQGIESERTNMALHANAAMAALKINCFVQAIEHCDKVLSIAEFLHNNRKDPLCVKALQRRAEAYRALQQAGRAVRDLEAALEVEPGNAEVAKQLAKARVEDEEARKQRAIAKAVRRGAGGDGESTAPVGAGAGVVEAGGVTLDLEKLGRVERLAAALAPVAPPATPSDSASPQAESSGSGSSNSKNDGPAQSDGPTQQQQNASGVQRGPSLPPRPAKGGGSGVAASGAGASENGSGGAGSSHGRQGSSEPSTSSTASTCSQLRALLRNDDPCCVYFRECGGLQHLATRIIKRHAGAESDLAVLLMLLNDACMNDGNLKQLPALKVLPAVLGGLDGAGEEAAGAAATLLCTAVTNEDVRKEVSRLLGVADNMARLVRLLSTAKPVVQGVVSALLGNCMVDKPAKAAMAAAWRQDAAAADCFLALLSCRNAALAEKAAVLLGNMATDAALRAEVLARHGGVMRQLVALTSGGGACTSPSAAAAQPQLAAEVQRAAATALFNLTVDEQGQRLVAEDAVGVAALYGMVQPLHSDRALAARAAGVCARVAKPQAGAAALLRLGAVEGMLQVMTAAMDGLEAGGGTPPESGSGNTCGTSSGSNSGGDREANAALLDAAVRVVTILTSPDDPALASQLVAAGGVTVLLRAIRAASPTAGKRSAGGSAVGPKGSAGAGTGGGAGLGESVLANAVLCLAGVARRREHLALLRDADPVPVLVDVAYEGRGNTASKNAAIALARLAQEPAMLERLRELHGIEIIYQYVKP